MSYWNLSVLNRATIDRRVLDTNLNGAAAVGGLVLLQLGVACTVGAGKLNQLLTCIYACDLGS